APLRWAARGGGAPRVGGAVSREETLHRRPKPLAPAVPAMKERTTHTCECLGWGRTRREEIRHGYGIHKNRCSWWQELVRGACHSDLTGPSLFLVLNASRVPYTLLVCSSHRTAGCAHKQVRS